MNMEPFAMRLRQLRARHGLTLMDLAERVDVSFQAVAGWSNGSRRPSIEHLIGLADLFGVSLDYLVGREGVKDR